METVVHRDGGVEWSVVSRPLPGQDVSGDRHVVAPLREGVLVGVIDGLGHGEEATRAACKAAELVEAHANEPLVQVVRRCHDGLRDTRGVVMTLVAVDRVAHTASALGIGNVETVLVRAGGVPRPRESVLLRNGVVGYQLPALQVSTLTVSPGDILVFATDGVREDFGDRLHPGEPLTRIVDRILAQKFRGTDDALVLACRLLEDHEA